MKKILTCIIAVVFIFTLALLGTSCKEEAVEEAVEEVEEAVEEAVEEEAVEEEVVAEEALTFTHVNASDPADPFISKISIGWNEACDKLGVTSNEQFAYNDIANIIDYTEAAIAANVDGIYVFNSVDPDALHPSIEKAVEKGIAVALTSSRDPVYGPDKVTFCGFDLEDQGHTTGVWLAEQLEAAGRTTDVEVAIFAEANAPYSQMRSGGSLRALDEAGITYNASEIYEVGIDLGVAVDLIKSYMLANPDTDVILAMGSLSSPAGVMVLKELGYESGEVMWCGYDLAPEVITGIQDGYGASNVDEVFNYGFLPAIALYLRAKYDFVVGDLPIATVMVTEANVEDYVYWAGEGIK